MARAFLTARSPIFHWTRASGAYYDSGLAPLRIRVEDRFVRAAQGGVGGAKTGANYAASLLGAEEAQAAGFEQVLWLDGAERRYLEEVGTMNVMLRFGNEVVTPPLNGSTLAGVVRDSALTLLRDWGIQVSERPIPIAEVVAAARSKVLWEIWGTGTAATIVPVGELDYRGDRVVVHGGRVGKVTERLYQAITGIQYARVEDRHGWMLPV